MTRRRLLDLFCGSGGVGMGYHLAGFDVVGVDNEAQLRGTINAAIRNNVAFFPIDARGLGVVNCNCHQR